MNHSIPLARSWGVFMKVPLGDAAPKGELLLKWHPFHISQILYAFPIPQR